jgi:hypothetical protein
MCTKCIIYAHLLWRAPTDDSLYMRDMKRQHNNRKRMYSKLDKHLMYCLWVCQYWHQWLRRALQWCSWMLHSVATRRDGARVMKRADFVLRRIERVTVGVFYWDCYCHSHRQTNDEKVTVRLRPWLSRMLPSWFCIGGTRCKTNTGQKKTRWAWIPGQT